jgi:thioredoxin reductase
MPHRCVPITARFAGEPATSESGVLMSLNHDDVHDVIIVGGGPAGLSAALILARACRRVVVIDAGQPRNSAALHMHGYLTRDGISPHELLEKGRQELASYGVTVVPGEATSCRRLAPIGPQPLKTHFGVTLKEGGALAARKLLLATGAVDEVPEFPGVRECYGVSVHHCPYCDGWEHRGARLVAYGDTPEKAVGLGLALRTWSNQVTVLSDGQSFSEHDKKRLAARNIAASDERIRQLIHQPDGKCTGIELESSGVIPAEALFFNTRARARFDLARQLGCELTEEGFVCTHGKQQTAVPGLFLAGDADSDVQFVIVAAAEGAIAAVAINRELQDEDCAVC